MERIDFSEIVRRLNDAAEAYGSKALTDGAVKAWWATLQHESASDCYEAIAEWLRKGTRMPAPGDIYKLANERGIDRREDRAAEQKAEERRGTERFFRATEHGRQCLADIKAMLAKAPPDNPLAWAQRILDRKADGEIVSDYAFRSACEGLGFNPKTVLQSMRGEK